MPSINEVIERVNRARPDAIDDETKAAWLLELDGQLYRGDHPAAPATSGRGAKGPVAVCPTCGGTEITYDRVMDSNLCPACGWTDLPDFPKAFPEDGDKPPAGGGPLRRAVRPVPYEQGGLLQPGGRQLQQLRPGVQRGAGRMAETVSPQAPAHRRRGPDGSILGGGAR